MKTIQLQELPLGKTCHITEVNAHGTEKQRMTDLGLAKGASVKALHVSPCGDPKAYAVMGAVIALRKSDAAKIIVEES